MTYASAPFWWLTCDAPGCGVKSTEDGEYDAWAEEGVARDHALDSGWVGPQDDQQHYCNRHRRYVCIECEKSEGREYPLDHEGMCDECWTEDAKQNHGVRTEPS